MIDNIKAQYELKHNSLIIFKDELMKQLDAIIKRDKIKLAFPIEGRVKELSSILKNLELDKDKYKTIEDVKDIVGLRIIVLMADDCSLVSNEIEKLFKIRKIQMKQDELAVNQFGYSSIHYTVNIRKEWAKIPTLNEMETTPIEIQIRTASQHIWAVLSHHLQYKKQLDVPNTVIRSINRVAAILELVDMEMSRVNKERVEYQNTIAKPSEILNTDLIRMYLDKELPIANKEENEPYAVLLTEFNNFGIKNFGDLQLLFKEYRADALEEERTEVKENRNRICGGEYAHEPERVKRGVYFCHAGLVRIMMNKKFGEAFENYQHTIYE